MSRPGMMLYFDNFDPLKRLSHEELGQLFLAILEYGKDGTVPQFEGMLAMAWAFLAPKIDWDGQKYARRVATSRYGTYCREAARRGEIPISREAWFLLTEDDQKHMVSVGIIRYPTADASPNAITTPSNHQPASVTKADHRRSQVMLSPYQLDSLRAKMDEETLSLYLDRLNKLIISDPSFDGDHYLTILCWWSQGIRE